MKDFIDDWFAFLLIALYATMMVVLYIWMG